MTVLRHILLVLFFSASALNAVPAADNKLNAGQLKNIPAGHVQAELVSELSTIVPGQPFTAALHFKIAPHWHTYWINSGDSGIATALAWTLPSGFIASDIQWPYPKRMNAGSDIVNFGYENEVYHLVTVTPPKDLPTGKSVVLAAKATWLECAEICVPGEADLQLKLKVGETAIQSPQYTAIQETKKKLPIRDDKLQVTASYDAHNLTLQIHQQPESSNPVFFPYAEELITNSANQHFSNHKLVIPLAENPQIPTTLSGVITTAAGAYEINVPLNAAINRTDGSIFPFTFILAFLGGLILNLMPCVFPVLGIKILGFVNQAGQDKKQVARHGLAFTLGVLASFWLLAGLLIALRSSGQQLGWGFQLQSPTFVYTLTIILFLFGLNLSGVFEFGASLIGVGSGSKLTGSHRLSGSFFSGVLATVVATPCAAPFLATALGAALTLNPVSSLALFTAIALGLALPYLVLSMFPQLLGFLPKPGAWMESFKQFMAFPLYASAAFLLWVLAAQVGDTAFLKILLSLALLGMAVWIYGRWAGPEQSVNRRVIIRLIVLLLLVGGIFFGWPKSVNNNAQIEWQKWSPELVEQLRAQNKIVYVDFTARWCATCQTNKALVFSSKEVLTKFKELGVVAVKADWTNQDPQITKELARFGKSAVPFNLIYLPNKSEPIQLPELLTPQIVSGALHPQSP